jgi:hypothetical protein
LNRNQAGGRFSGEVRAQALGGSRRAAPAEKAVLPTMTTSQAPTAQVVAARPAVDRGRRGEDADAKGRTS